jgi:hypothetical protein
MAGRACTICIHPHRAAIDSALVAGQRGNDVASEYRVSPDAISRHRLHHLARVEVELAGAPVSVGPGDIIGSIADLQTRIMRILRRAESRRDLRGALACIREASNLLTIHGRLTGLIRPDGAVVNVGVLTGSDDRTVAAARARVAGKLAAIAGSQAAIDADAA